MQTGVGTMNDKFIYQADAITMQTPIAQELPCR
jgi:hypothetical protein